MPPDQEEIRIGGPGDFLWAVERFELIEELGDREGVAHGGEESERGSV